MVAAGLAMVVIPFFGKKKVEKTLTRGFGIALLGAGFLALSPWAYSLGRPKGEENSLGFTLTATAVSLAAGAATTYVVYDIDAQTWVKVVAVISTSFLATSLTYAAFRSPSEPKDSPPPMMMLPLMTF